MDEDESCSLSLDHSYIDDPMIITVESLDSGKKRKLRAEESDLLPLTKHFCLEKQASLPDSSCPSSDIDSSKKRKLRAEESDLLPLTKHFCLEKQASLPDSSCPSSDIEYTECSYAMDDTKTSDETSSSPSITGPSLSMFKDSSYSTGSSGYATSSNIDQCCSKGNEKSQEYFDDLSLMEMIYPEFAVEDLQEVLNPVGSFILSSERWSVNNQGDVIVEISVSNIVLDSFVIFGLQILKKLPRNQTLIKSLRSTFHHL